MRKFHRDHQRAWALLTPGAALSLGLWLLALGCSVYDDALLDDEGPVAGSGGSGVSGSGSDGGMTTQPQAGKASGGTGATQGSGAEPGAGKGGVTAGSAGDAAGSSTAGTPSAGSSSAGAGGMPASGDADAVDDMEDGNAQIASAPGRNGYWYVGNDGTVGGTQEPPVDAFAMAKLTAGERQNSSYAAHTKVTGFKGWGSVLGLNFTEQLGTVQAYDASAYCGVRYWAKAAVATTLRLRIPDGDTHPVGGVCVDGGAAGMACYDHFSSSAAFTTEWQQFSVMFGDLQQTGTGYHPSDMKLKADKLYGLEWALSGANQTYEIWIDDVELLKCP
jgi:hypothetical protein